MPRNTALAIALIITIALASCAIDMERYGRAMPGGMSVCAGCHITGDDGAPAERGNALRAPAEALCAGCHAERLRTGEHRVGMLMTRPTSLPLYAARVECPTCHEPHGLDGNSSLLRLPASSLCRACHDK